MRAFSDPNIDCDRQPIFWSPEVLPIVLHLQPACPDLTSNPLDVGAALTAPSAGTHRTGATTDVLIAHGMGKKWLSSASVTHVEKSVTKMYVGATRARHSLAFVFDGLAAIPGAQIYE